MYVQIKYLKLKDLQRSKAGLGYSEKFKALISGIDRLVRASLERRVKKHVEWGTVTFNFTHSLHLHFLTIHKIQISSLRRLDGQQNNNQIFLKIQDMNCINIWYIAVKRISICFSFYILVFYCIFIWSSFLEGDQYNLTMVTIKCKQCWFLLIFGSDITSIYFFFYKCLDIFCYHILVIVLRWLVYL